MIDIQHLSKTYKGSNTKALDDINLHIDDADIFGIVGLSGAGKSSLVRCINRLEEPDEGTVSVNGVDLLKLDKKSLRQQRKNIGMIFQQFNLFSSKTVFENIAFPLNLDKKDNTYIKNRVEELLEIVELSDKINAYPSELSGGQKQRVGIARAIANHPQVLLCDEATSALDPKTTSQILDLLQRINMETGLTLIVITHEMEVIKQICNKVAIIENGKIIDQASTIDIFSQKPNEKTEHFIKYDFNLPKGMYDLKKYALTFTQGEAQNAVISRVSRELNIDINILSGNIEYIQEQPLGRLLIGIDDNSKEPQMIDFLTKHNIRVEEVKNA